MVELREINHGNWLQCIELEVADEQRRFINPNIFSLAEAYVHSDANKADAEEFYRCIQFAVYHGEEMVGFAQLTYEKDYDFDGKPAYEIYKVMIDKKHQGKGFGKGTVRLLLDYLKTAPYGEADHIYVQWHPENTASERMFTAAGFVIVGTDEDGAVIARLKENV